MVVIVTRNRHDIDRWIVKKRVGVRQNQHAGIGLCDSVPNVGIAVAQCNRLGVGMPVKAADVALTYAQPDDAHSQFFHDVSVSLSLSAIRPATWAKPRSAFVAVSSASTRSRSAWVSTDNC